MNNSHPGSSQSLCKMHIGNICTHSLLDCSSYLWDISVIFLETLMFQSQAYNLIHSDCRINQWLKKWITIVYTSRHYTRDEHQQVGIIVIIIKSVHHTSSTVVLPQNLAPVSSMTSTLPWTSLSRKMWGLTKSSGMFRSLGDCFSALVGCSSKYDLIVPPQEGCVTEMNSLKNMWQRCDKQLLAHLLIKVLFVN